MPQLQLPIFPVGVTHITAELAFECRDGVVTYFNGQMPVFRHPEDDRRSFRMIISQFVENGNAQQAEIARAFGVPAVNVKRAVKCYREHGTAGFFTPRGGKRRPTVLTAGGAREAAGPARRRDAVGAGRARAGGEARHGAKGGAGRAVAGKKSPDGDGDVSTAPSTKSARSTLDSEAPMGMGATDTVGRVLAAFGKVVAVNPEFEPAADVPNAGVLAALPALLSCGLLRGSGKYFAIPPGYYGLPTIFLLVAFLALARVRSLEGLRYCAPGEWGKVLGLDRVPEVRTLRAKLRILTTTGQPEQWSAELCRQWMEADPEATGVFYVDGHVRVYHGAQTDLPRRYVSRQRLCLRGTTDYWVNALDAQPFFVVTKAVDPGMVQVIEHEIVPRLERDAPQLVSDRELIANPLRHRFVIVCDREVYSPVLFAKLRKKHIACSTYRRSPGPDWPSEEFCVEPVTLTNGQTVTMTLAERGVFLDRGKLWVREIRRRTASGHQTAIVSTDFINPRDRLAAPMFGRWGQENFFRYMLEHYGLDRLISYGLEAVPETTRVVNPAHRELDAAVRKRNAVLSRRRAEFGALTLDQPITTALWKPGSRRRRPSIRRSRRSSRRSPTSKQNENRRLGTFSSRTCLPRNVSRSCTAPASTSSTPSR